MVAKPTSMFWRIILQSLRLRLSRVFIIFTALTVGASIVTAMAAIYFDINRKMSQELRTFGANFYIAAKQGNLLPEQQINHILQQAPTGLINAASPYLYGVIRSELEKIVIMGVWFEEMKNLAPYWQIEGNPIGVNFDDRNAMIGKSLANRLQVKVGDKITLIKNAIERKQFNIKAIVEAGDATDNMLIVNLTFAQDWLDKEGLANNALLSVNNQQGQAELFAQQLQQQYPQLDVHLIRKVSVAEGQILNKIKGLMGLICLVILVLASLCVNTTLIAMISERSKEFALQKALGAKKQDIILQISCEILFICSIATLTGLIIGYLLAQLLGLAVFKSYIDLRLPVIPLTFILSLFVAFTATIIPAKRALNVQMATLLKGE
ncbi:ABC transporter permease [Volucribacter amazonae]|uniref:ABC transport system permease protein n=1 Tax=Volucribacter amazonae TaxID=256731 RepID=A0A9X4P8V6_9PAST|nr:FtsX-like permease family protein [Volucribacter amazonae]MDG6894648.1 hypothetical protein [Volucribacter amazonae]